MRRFRLGMLIGFAAGYVMGTRAGRERYEQIMEAWHKLANSEPAQQLAGQAQEMASLVSAQLERGGADMAAQAAGMPREDSSVRTY